MLLKWVTFGRQVDMRMIFDELKRDMRAAMEEKEEEEDTRSNYQIKPYWRFSRGSPISTRWPCPVYFARKSSHSNICLSDIETSEITFTLPSMSRTVWPEPEEKEDDYESSYHIKQPSPYSLYKYRLWTSEEELQLERYVICSKNLWSFISFLSMPFRSKESVIMLSLSLLWKFCCYLPVKTTFV